MWQALTADTPSQVTAVAAEASAWLVWREQLVTRFRSLPTDEQRALDSLIAGGRFIDACDVLATLLADDDVPLRIASLLKGWIVQGLISATE